MAIRVERTGTRTVVAQTRRAVRIASWTIAGLAVVGVLMMVLDSREARERDHAVVRCDRSAGQCEVARGRDNWVMRLESISGVQLETEGAGEDARVAALIARRDGLPTYTLCEAGSSAPEAAGIKAAVEQLDRFVADRRIATLEVACDTQRPDSGPGALAVRALAQTAGTLLMLFALLIFLVEIRTEIDPEAGLVRVVGRSAVPRRRWSVERGIAEVADVMVGQRGWGRQRSFTIYLRFRDGSLTVVLTPTTGWGSKVDDWMAALRQGLGLPSPPAASSSPSPSSPSSSQPPAAS